MADDGGVAEADGGKRRWGENALIPVHQQSRQAIASQLCQSNVSLGEDIEEDTQLALHPTAMSPPIGADGFGMMEDHVVDGPLKGRGDMTLRRLGGGGRQRDSATMLGQ